MDELSAEEVARLKRLLATLTDQHIEIAGTFLPCLTDDPEEARKIAEGLGAVSRNADGLVKVSSISEELVLFSAMLPHIMRDAKRDEAWATVFEDLSRRARAVADFLKNVTVIAVWGVVVVGVIYGGLWATGRLDGLLPPP